MRVSGVLPKWMVGKFLEREYASLRTRIKQIHDNFEVDRGPLFPQPSVILR